LDRPVEGYAFGECSPVLMADPVAENRVPGTAGVASPEPSFAWARDSLLQRSADG